MWLSIWNMFLIFLLLVKVTVSVPLILKYSHYKLNLLLAVTLVAFAVRGIFKLTVMFESLVFFHCSRHNIRWCGCSQSHLIQCQFPAAGCSRTFLIPILTLHPHHSCELLGTKYFPLPSLILIAEPICNTPFSRAQSISAHSSSF